MTRNDGRANAGQDVILVTGATGHVGRQVVSQLLRTGAAVRALTRTSAPRRRTVAAWATRP
jgi:uncharacterized protein YbjT (DUF2867 family)